MMPLMLFRFPFMKTLLNFLFLVCFLNPGFNPVFGSLAETEKVFSESILTVEHNPRLRGRYQEQYSIDATGSGFRLEIDGVNYFLTAAHVVSLSATNPTPLEIDGTTIDTQGDSRQTLISHEFRLAVSPYSIKPKRILVDDALDLAIFTFSDSAWERLNLKALPVAERMASPGESVVVWGFPGTPNPQIRTGLSISSADRFIVLNQSIEGGFSGGPVMNSASEVIGVVLRSLERGQTRCVHIRDVISLIARFDAESVLYTDGSPLPR